MLQNNIKVDAIVNYTNGGKQVQTGIVKKLKSKDYFLIVNNDSAAIELYNAGYAIGDEIHISQIISYEQKVN